MENLYIMKLLIEKGANINANTAAHKPTPLMCASIIVEALIKRGADKNIRDKLRCTALDWAKIIKMRVLICLMKITS